MALTTESREPTRLFVPTLSPALRVPKRKGVMAGVSKKGRPGPLAWEGFHEASRSGVRLRWVTLGDPGDSLPAVSPFPGELRCV